jgi:septal ring factor EnvC (AmiA/AmiB activator)
VALMCLPLWGMPANELRAQDQPKPLASNAAGINSVAAGSAVAENPSSSLTDDRFPEQRSEADRLRDVYEPMHQESMGEIDKLMRTKRCQIARVSGLLNRNSEAMHRWLDAEKLYWKAWGDAEQSRVGTEQKSLANIEADQTRAADLVDSEKQVREDLQRRRAALMQGAPTEAIRAQIDELLTDIQDSEARLSSAQATYTALTEKISNFKTSLTARLVTIRQQQSRLDAYALDVDAFYEKTRASAQEICNSKAPDSKQTPLPKNGKQ